MMDFHATTRPHPASPRGQQRNGATRVSCPEYISGLLFLLTTPLFLGNFPREIYPFGTRRTSSPQALTHPPTKLHTPPTSGMCEPNTKPWHVQAAAASTSAHLAAIVVQHQRSLHVVRTLISADNTFTCISGKISQRNLSFRTRVGIFPRTFPETQNLQTLLFP